MYSPKDDLVGRGRCVCVTKSYRSVFENIWMWNMGVHKTSYRSQTVTE